MMEDLRELMEALRKEIADWESSAYYVRDEEIIDIEGFLRDRKAWQVLEHLERAYGAPINRTFWARFLPYHRLRRARLLVKAQEDTQDAKHREYLRRVRDARQAWLEDVRSPETRTRPQLHVIEGKRDPPRNT